MSDNYTQMKIGDGDLSFSFFVKDTPFEKLSRSTTAAIATTPRIGNLPAQQFTGIASDTFTVEGVLFPAIGHKSKSSLKQLRHLLEAGKAYLITTSAGDIYGKYMISEISNSHTELLVNGLPQQIDFSVKFIRAEK